MKRCEVLGKRIILSGEYEKLRDLAASRDWSLSDIVRLGLLRFRLYDALAKITERQVGGVIARARITKSAGSTFYRIQEDDILRRAKGAEPEHYGLQGGESTFKKSKGLKTFFICKAIAHGQYVARFSDGERTPFELHLPDFYMSINLLKRIKAAGLYVEKPE